MTDTFVATKPRQPDLSPEYLARIHPRYAFRTYRCVICGREQYDAGQIPASEDTGTCQICGSFWSLVLVWPKETR